MFGGQIEFKKKLGGMSYISKHAIFLLFPEKNNKSKAYIAVVGLKLGENLSNAMSRTVMQKFFLSSYF